MVDVAGHLGLALLAALPAWAVWDRFESLLFSALALATAMLPDVDLLLASLWPSRFHHHGVTHTVLFTLVASLVGAAVLAWVVPPAVHRVRDSRTFFDRRVLFGYLAAAFLVGGLAHVLGDVLSAPDTAQPVEPFWPVYDKPVALDVFWYTSPLVNWGLLAAGVLLTLGLYAWKARRT